MDICLTLSPYDVSFDSSVYNFVVICYGQCIWIVDTVCLFVAINIIRCMMVCITLDIDIVVLLTLVSLSCNHDGCQQYLNLLIREVGLWLYMRNLLVAINKIGLRPSVTNRP
eukprot:156552_1